MSAFGAAASAVVAKFTSVMEAANENTVARIAVESVEIVIGQAEIIEIGHLLLFKVAVLAPYPLSVIFFGVVFFSLLVIEVDVPHRVGQVIAALSL